VDGFPLTTEGHVTSTPLIVDLDGDGDLEVAVGEAGSSTPLNHFHVWDLEYAVNPRMMTWPMFQRDPQNTGRYPLPWPWGSPPDEKAVLSSPR